MAEKTQTPPVQTQAEIVAALRAKNAKANSTFYNVLRSIPLLPLGGAVDLGNAVAGTLAGKGFLKPLVEKPVGGLKDLKERFRIPELAPDNTLGQVLEAAASMMTPGGAAKAIIIPFTAAQATRAGVSKIADQARRTYMKTGDNAKVLEESNRALKAANFPMAIEGMFFGPDMKLRASLSNEAFKPNFYKQLFGIDPVTGAVTIQGPLLGGQNTIRASELMAHESLYKLVPELQSTRIRHDPRLDIKNNVAGNYDSTANVIGLPKLTPLVTGVSPMQELISTVKHELTHAASKAGKTRSGAAKTPDSLIKAVQEAKTMGTFADRGVLDELLYSLIDIKHAATDPTFKSIRLPADPEAFINQTYRKIYGEREAVASESPGLPDLKLLMDSY